MELRCSECGSSAEASCECGVAYIPASEYARRELEKHPEMSDRALAAKIGVGTMTVSRARKKVGVPNGTPEKRVGKDGKSYPASSKTALKEWVSTWEIVPGTPLGPMPEDIREKMQECCNQIHHFYFQLLQAARYAEQMSPELRHLMADKIRGLSSNLRDVSHTFLGEKDWRKIRRPYCDEEIPLRIEDTKWN
ncbi:MAG TPA: hypothetical protein VH593_06640 [Ktedonobacteraceae bacterium]